MQSLRVGGSATPKMLCSACQHSILSINHSLVRKSYWDQDDIEALHAPARWRLNGREKDLGYRPAEMATKRGNRPLSNFDFQGSTLALQRAQAVSSSENQPHTLQTIFIILINTTMELGLRHLQSEHQKL